jgi:hypothetical protein
MARGQAALDWLLTQQNTTDYPGAFPCWSSAPPDYSEGGVLYEGGLAGETLIRGYTFTPPLPNRDAYLTASNLLCEYLCGLPTHLQGNANAFAIKALAANFEVTGNADYLDKALEFMNAMVAYQLDSGMWADDHNQNCYYHGIMTQSLVKLLHAMETQDSTNPKIKVVEHALYKALNHMRQRQNYATSPHQQAGALVRHPLRSTLGDYYCPFSVRAAAEAYAAEQIIPADASLNSFTQTIVNLPKMTSSGQGAEFATIGVMLESYY